MEISCNGFRKTGLVPLNRHISRDHDFCVHQVEHLPADRATDHSESEVQGDGTNQHLNENACTSANPKEIDQQVNQNASAFNFKETNGVIRPSTPVPFREQRKSFRKNTSFSDGHLSFAIVQKTRE